MNAAVDPVQAAIAQAAAQAQQAQASQVPGVTSLPAVQTTGTGVAPVTPGQAFSMETIGAGQMSVDSWLKVTEFGLRIGENSELFANAEVVLDMSDRVGFTVKQGIKGGNPAQYAYTFDGAIANDGKPWDAAIVRIRQLAPSASPYPCVDLPFETIVPILGTAIGAPAGTPAKQLIEAGKRLGYTTSTTNWGNWVSFYNAVKAANLLGKKVKVKIGCQPRSNKAGNKWGVVSFELVGEYIPDEAE